jgi:hypothetical protein
LPPRSPSPGQPGLLYPGFRLNLSLTPNLALRWITLSGVLLLAADCLLLALIVRKITWLGGARSRHPAVRWLQFAIVTVLVIVGSAWLLSSVGALDARGFLGLP